MAGGRLDVPKARTGWLFNTARTVTCVPRFRLRPRLGQGAPRLASTSRATSRTLRFECWETYRSIWNASPPVIA